MSIKILLLSFFIVIMSGCSGKYNVVGFIGSKQDNVFEEDIIMIANSEISYEFSLPVMLTTLYYTTPKGSLFFVKDISNLEYEEKEGAKVKRLPNSSLYLPTVLEVGGIEGYSGYLIYPDGQFVFENCPQIHTVIDEEGLTRRVLYCTDTLKFSSEKPFKRYQ